MDAIAVTTFNWFLKGAYVPNVHTGSFFTTYFWISFQPKWLSTPGGPLQSSSSRSRCTTSSCARPFALFSEKVKNLAQHDIFVN